MFKLKSPVGTNYRIEPNDLMNTKRALNQLDYYDIPPHRGIDDWTDDAMFNGIKQFQKHNNLKVDGFMRPGGPTEQKINTSLTEKEGAPGLGEGETPQRGTGKDYPREQGNNMPVIVPPMTDPNMPEIKKLPPKLPGPYIDKNGNLILNDPGPLAPRRVRPPKGPY